MGPAAVTWPWVRAQPRSTGRRAGSRLACERPVGGPVVLDVGGDAVSARTAGPLTAAARQSVESGAPGADHDPVESRH